MGYTEIAAAIVSTLQTVSSLHAVFNTEPKELGQYPCATVTASAHQDTFATIGVGGRNQRVFTFTIRLYYRTDVAEDAETILRSVTDDVIVALEHDTTLGGVVDIARPTDAKWVYATRELPVRVVEITEAAMIKVAR